MSVLSLSLSLSLSLCIYIYIYIYIYKNPLPPFLKRFIGYEFPCQSNTPNYKYTWQTSSIIHIIHRFTVLRLVTYFTEIQVIQVGY